MRSTILVVALSAACALGVRVGETSGQGLPAHGGSASGVLPSSKMPANDPSTFTGKVLETMDSGGYTYIRLLTPQGEGWAAVSPAKVTVGDQVTIVNAFVMSDFDAKSLGRRFDQIIFGNLGGEAPIAPPHAGNPGEERRDTGPIAKLEGADGRTIAEVWAQRLQLKDKPVAVRGKVVKLNRGIMGRNWVHIQDGTGTQATSDFDLTVTTNDEAKIGDVVVVRGVAHVDRDFGAGYSYQVLVEDARIEQARAAVTR